MNRRSILLFLIVISLVTLACGLPGGLGGGDADEDAPQTQDGSSGEGDQGGAGDTGGAPLAADDIADPGELSSYRMRLVWRAEDETGTESFRMSMLEEWVKEPPAKHVVISGSEPGQEPQTVLEYYVIGDQAWMGLGGTWVESEPDQTEGLAGSWTASLGEIESWDYKGRETVNSVNTKSYSSGESATMLIPGAEGGSAQVSVRGETWIADEAGLPPVTIRERTEIEGGFLPFALPGATEAAPAEGGVFYSEYDLTDINSDIVISPPDMSGGEAPAPAGASDSEGTTEGGSDGDSADASTLPAPPAQTQTGVRSADAAILHLIPAGPFIMGDDGSPFASERPAHLVYLEDYWIDETEVTNAQYRLCVGAGACIEPPVFQSPDLSGDQQPVLVPWSGAVAYCRWVGGRLPTEAEWEKAARGTDARLWPWGQEFVEGMANLNGDADGYGFTSPAGAFPGGASPYGLMDMAGNAAEWVADWFGEDYYDGAPEQSPTGPAGGEQKVIRSTLANGGGGREKVRTVARYPAEPEHERWHYGFRCVSTTQP